MMNDSPTKLAEPRHPRRARALPAGVSTRTVLFADMVGYSTRMSRDERGTLEFMIACSNLIEELSLRHGGLLLQTTGDGYLLVFERTLGAVEFGAELHRLISKRQGGRPDRARFRVGIHVGTVHIVNGAIYGHAVNIAARLQNEALPGTCVLSQHAYEEVRAECPLPFEAIGKPPLKNIAEQIALYRLPEEGPAALVPTQTSVLVAVIGTVRLRAGGRDLTFPAVSKMSGLFAYLAMSEGMRQSQEKVGNLMWPERTDAARRGFAQCRRKLVQLLSDDLAPLLVFANRHVGMNELHFDTDLQLIEKDLRRGRVPATLIEVPDWPEKILEGFEAISTLYAAWLRVVRSGWRSRFLSLLSDILAAAEAGSDVTRDAACAVLAIDPGNEAAAAALIRHYTRRQNRSAALQEYARVEAYLRSQHDLAPGAAVREAVRLAREDGAAPATAARRSALVLPNTQARLLRIAVAPFAQPAAPQAHLIEGFRSDLLANLARFREWSVTKDEDAEQTAQPATGGHGLGDADYVVEGAYLQTATGWLLRINLRDNRFRRVVWSDDLVISLRDWAQLQRSIVSRIAAHLETYISADRLHQMVRSGQDDSISHDAWLRAEQVFARWTPEAADEAEQRLRAIIESDAGFAPAYASLASVRNVQHVVRPGLPRDAAGARAAHGYAQRAVEIDPLDARNHLSVAWTAAMTDAFDRAAIHLDLAASLNPNSASTLVSCAMAYAFIGQNERGETLVRHVKRISPMLSDYQWCYVASVHFLSGHYEEALRAGRFAADRIVDNSGWMAATLARLGRIDEAGAAFERLIDAVRPVWAGSGPPTAEAVFEWFTSAYPLRHPADRDGLRQALGQAMQGLQHQQ